MFSQVYVLLPMGEWVGIPGPWSFGWVGIPGSIPRGISGTFDHLIFSFYVVTQMYSSVLQTAKAIPLSGGSRIFQGRPTPRSTYYLSKCLPKAAWKWKKLSGGSKRRTPPTRPGPSSFIFIQFLINFDKFFAKWYFGARFWLCAPGKSWIRHWNPTGGWGTLGFIRHCFWLGVVKRSGRGRHICAHFVPVDYEFTKWTISKA